AGPRILVVHTGKTQQSLADAAIERTAILDGFQGLGTGGMTARKSEGQQYEEREDHSPFLEIRHLDLAIGGSFGVLRPKVSRQANTTGRVPNAFLSGTVRARHGPGRTPILPIGVSGSSRRLDGWLDDSRWPSRYQSEACRSDATVHTVFGKAIFCAISTALRS